MTEIQIYDADNTPSCNVSLQTGAWNKLSLDYVNPHCNISSQTNAWNQACLDSIKD